MRRVAIMRATDVVAILLLEMLDAKVELLLLQLLSVEVELRVMRRGGT